MASKPLNELVLKPRHLAMLQQILSDYAPSAEIWAYGSRVNGDGHEGSDLDLVAHHIDWDTVATLKEQFQNSLLPMLIDLHRWESLPPAFQQNIVKSYIVIQS